MDFRKLKAQKLKLRHPFKLCTLISHLHFYIKRNPVSKTYEGRIFTISFLLGIHVMSGLKWEKFWNVFPSNSFEIYFLLVKKASTASTGPNCKRFYVKMTDLWLSNFMIKCPAFSRMRSIFSAACCNKSHIIWWHLQTKYTQ